MSTEPQQDEQMNEDIDLSMRQSVVRGVIGLGLFAIITAGLIALTQVSTADRIAEQEKLARSKALFEIVPLTEHDNDMLSDAFWLEASELGLKDLSEVFVAKTGGTAHTLILPVVAPDGYTGPIQLIVGINQNGLIKGVRVTSHKETPGLGDKIDIKKSDWIRSFEGKSLDNLTPEQWKVKKDGGDFDQLTGATITPRAIVNAIYKALQFYRMNQVQLFQQSPDSELALSSTDSKQG